MTRRRLLRGRRSGARGGSQSGVVLLFALISVLIVMIAAVALIRSFNASLFSAGNIAFKRDLQNRSDLAIQAAMADFRTGGLLAGSTARQQNVAAANYSASALSASQVNNQNIPLALQRPPQSLQSAGFTKPAPAMVDQVTYYYVIERLCDAPGDEIVLGTARCLVANERQKDASAKDQTGAAAQTSGSCGSGPCRSAVPLGVVYRISVRVSGPRNTLSFFQTTLTAP